MSDSLDLIERVGALNLDVERLTKAMFQMMDVVQNHQAQLEALAKVVTGAGLSKPQGKLIWPN